jgi:hypothetical protein
MVKNDGSVQFVQVPFSSGSRAGHGPDQARQPCSVMLTLVIIFRRLLTAFDRLSSGMLGRDGSVRNVRSQLDDRRRAYEEIEVLARRLAALETRVVPRAA